MDKAVKITLLLLVAVNLASCSNNTLYLKKQHLKKELIHLLTKDETYTVKLISNKGLSKWQVIEKEKKKLSLAKQKCFLPYTKSVQAITTKALKDSRSINHAVSLGYKQSTKLENALPSCLRPLGVTGSIKYFHEGKNYSTPQFAKFILSKNKTYLKVNGQNTVASISEEILVSSAKNALTLMKEMSKPDPQSNCHNVRGYYRNDGTYVRSHRRCR